jgi:hypothetical protein
VIKLTDKRPKYVLECLLASIREIEVEVEQKLVGVGVHEMFDGCCTLTGLSLPLLILHIYIALFVHSYTINSVLYSPSISHT